MSRRVREAMAARQAAKHPAPKIEEEKRGRKAKQGDTGRPAAEREPEPAAEPAPEGDEG